jgi:catechol 2,3-dioxygenase-like lactoylglutathione lyase family enzyme
MEFQLVVVRVFVRDWPGAIRFYTETLGIPLASRSDELGWAQLDTGAAQLALERFRPAEEGEAADSDAGLVGRFLGVSLAVADIDATYRRLRSRGVEFLEPPAVMPWGGVLAHLRDPDGNVVTLVGTPRRN